ncbi:Betaine reductase complex component B subunit beta [Slackia heliotrinireducens]|nr:Betaine reductase complex component B subunit beta [Slackia heliotrinireducens]
MTKKVIYYVNQFFGGIGGEDTADFEPEIREGQVGPAVAANGQLKDAEITHTIICGDNFMGSNTEEALSRILGFLEDKEFDLLIAGPAFQAGRYGVACGNVCKAVGEKFGVPTVTSMNVENPGVEMFKKDTYIMDGANAAAKMRKDLKNLVGFANKLLSGEPLQGAEIEGYFPRGIRHEIYLEDKHENTAAYRGVQMLIKKIKGEPFQTELVVPVKDVVEPAAPVNLSEAVIAMITTGGIVPVDNPDRIQSASATRWGRYNIEGVDKLPNRASGGYKTIHAGFDPAAADADPNVIMPIDAMRQLEKEGKFARLHNYFYSTVGTGTTESEAARMAEEMIPYLKEDGVNAIILGST